MQTVNTGKRTGQIQLPGFQLEDAFVSQGLSGLASEGSRDPTGMYGPDALRSSSSRADNVPCAGGTVPSPPGDFCMGHTSHPPAAICGLSWFSLLHLDVLPRRI